MASFESAIQNTLKNEGGEKYTDIAGDSGGPTKYGISLKFYNDKVDSTATGATIRALTESESNRCYKKYFWDEMGLDEMRYQAMASKIFDAAVNTGVRQAIRCAQRALWTQGEYGRPEDDGVMGPLTMMELNRVWIDAGKFLCSFKSELAGHYRMLAAVKSGNAKFINGWLARAYR